MDSLHAAREIRRALQTFITSNTDIMADESRMMEFATLYPTWEELLAAKKTTGGYTPCVPVEAVGLTYQGTVYNLLGHSEIEGAPTAYASMITETELLQILNSGTTSAVNAVNIMLGED